MTNVLLSSLLAGILTLGTPVGDVAPTTDHIAPSDSADVSVAPAGRSVFATDAAPEAAAEASEAARRSIIQDTYAYGISSALSPLKLWVQYAYGEADRTYDLQGEEAPLTVAGTEGQILAQRLAFGGQLNVINFPSFSLGAGAQGVVAKNEFQVTGGSSFTNPIGDIESDFEFQNVKVYGVARGRVVGIHGGYIFDLGNPREFGGEQARANIPGFGEQPLSIDADNNILPTALVAGNPAFQPIILPTSLSTSDGRDAIFFGADFDVPSNRFRVFGGIDYYMLQGAEDEVFTAFNEEDFDGDDYLNFMFGLGVKASIFEAGAAFQIQTRFDNPTTADVGTVRGIGGHIGRVSPYVRISPSGIPVSIFAKGAVLGEYSDSGAPIGGANAIKSKIGITAGLTVGFN